MNEILRFFAEGAVSIINVAAPVFPKVAPHSPAAYHVQAAIDMRKAYDIAKHEAENESSEAPRRAHSTAE